MTNPTLFELPEESSGGIDDRKLVKHRTLDLKTHKKIWIAVTGDVRLNKMETQIIDTPEFQRLRKLKQLGSAYLAFPTAVHTRFDHSLGTLGMLDKMITAIRNNKDNDDEERRISIEEEQLARLLALLHDIGHLPFGHTIEDEFKLLSRHDEDSDRIMQLIGRETNIGRIIISNTSEDFYYQFIKIITTNKNNQLELGEYLFIYDLVNNTVCADLLDYLKRDHYFCNIGLGLDFRFINHLYIFQEKFKDEKGGLYNCRRVAVRLQKKNSPKPTRTDLLDELVSLLEQRYKISQIAYFHHAKIVAGTMLAGAFVRAVNGKEITIDELSRMGDEELVYKLKKSKIAKVAEIALAFDNRKLYKCIYEKSKEVIDKEQGINRNIGLLGFIKNTFYETPGKRLEIEKEIAEQLGLEDGDILIHCPNYSMQMKHAEMNVLWNGEHKTLWKCEGAPIVHKKLELILESHQNLWSIRISVNSKYANDKDKVKQIQEACDYYLAIDDKEKGVKHYSNVVDNILKQDYDTTEMSADAFLKIKEEASETLLQPTSSDRSIKSIKGIVSDIAKKVAANKIEGK